MASKYPLQKYVDLIELSGLQEIFNKMLDNTDDAEIAFKDEEWLEMESAFKKKGKTPIFPFDYPPFKHGLTNRISIQLSYNYKDAIESFNENVNRFVNIEERNMYIKSLIAKVSELRENVYHNHKEAYGARLVQESLEQVKSYYSKQLGSEAEKVKSDGVDISQKLRGILKVLSAETASGTPLIQKGELDTVLKEIAYIIENKSLPDLSSSERFKIQISNIEFINYLFHEVNTAFNKSLPTGEFSRLLPTYLINRFNNYAGLQVTSITKKWSPGRKNSEYISWKTNILSEKGE